MPRAKSGAALARARNAKRMVNGPSPRCCQHPGRRRYRRAPPRRPPADHAKQESPAPWPRARASSGAALGSPAPTDKDTIPPARNSRARTRRIPLHRVIASTPVGDATAQLSRAGHQPITPNQKSPAPWPHARAVIRRGAQQSRANQDKDTIPPARNSREHTRRRPPHRGVAEAPRSATANIKS